MTCYDLRFPELPRALSRAGAELLVVPSAWVAGPRKVQHWRTLVTARAIENVAYVAAVGQSAPRYTGHSMLVDPRGDVVVEAGDDDEVWSGDLRPARGGPGREPVAAQPPRRRPLGLTPATSPNARVTRPRASLRTMTRSPRSVAVRAEMVANVLTVYVGPGDRVAAGDTVVLLESMKMEIPVLSEHAGTVSAVNVRRRRRPGGRRAGHPRPP